LVVGIGGLGPIISLYLAAAGAGRLGLIENDSVSISDLQRQVIYSEHVIERPKAMAAKRRLEQLYYIYRNYVPINILS